ncbi:3-phytase (myo-inositol-hexaphosphate 3-phosphohydrolase) [Caulobacter sp. AP07]|uniref:phytase n=1 Tax=Caulobacter sp. AP07 TaxID=1144304 RepID=UPI000271D9E9|nr:phytase [Caulobacter sp. AP07]EJL33315.1 3-phytase (myo-inositol-hexaphosphate 3-phosphohydrolase) [Caulobacter sp. AP07]
MIHRRTRFTAASALALLIAAPALAQTSSAQVTVAPVGATTPAAQGGANAAALLYNAADPTKSVLAATAELGGLAFYGLDGQRRSALPGGETYGVDVRDDLIAVLDRKDGRLRLSRYDFTTGAAASLDARPLTLGYAGEGLCLHRSARDGALYAFTLGGEGQLDQWLLFQAADGKLDGRIVRRLHLSSEAKYCVADDASGALYVAQQAVGIWRYDADPEAEAVATVIDINRLGRIQGEVGGLAVLNGGAQGNYLVAANADAGDYNVYDRNADDKFLGAFRIQAASADLLEAPSGLFGLRAPAGAGLPAGALLVTDDRKVGANTQVLSWKDVAAALNVSPGADTPTVAPSKLTLVTATMETRPVDHGGDAADDPAIYVHPTDPAKSAIIATDKKGGMLVYDLSGKLLQHLPDGKMNNVDLRHGFKLAGKSVTLVTASDRTHKAVAIYTIDPETRLLTSVADGVQATGLSDPYGLCMYRNRKGATFVFISDPNGLVRQWKLVATPAGKVRAQPVRDVKFDTQTEGCVADDETGKLYVAEEDVALWTLGAEPATGTARKAVARVADNPALKDDLEGVGLYAQAGGKGYLVVSSQGNNSYALFRREGDNAYVGSFAVIADGASGIDGISETDGLEVTSASLGAGLEGGAFVAQDGRNVSPPENQNFKLVPWSTIARKLGLN